jgi:hypothetical protein
LRRILKEAVMFYFEILSRNVPERTEKSTKNSVTTGDLRAGI